MEYLSAFFRATQSIIDLSRRRDPELVQLFFGIVGVPDDMPVDAVQLKAQLADFGARELKRGPLRREDVVKVAQMVRLQEKEKIALNEYDGDTGTLWEWDGNALVLVVVCELACEAAVQLGDQDLYADCASLLWGALRSFEEVQGSQFDPIRPLARARAEAIAERLDVDAILAAFDAGMPEVVPA